MISVVDLQRGAAQRRYGRLALSAMLARRGRSGFAETKGQVTLVCLNCGCMHAHDDMGKPGVNIVYEDVKRAADANGTTVEQALQTMAATAAKDRGDHPTEYGSATGRDGEPA